MAIKNETKVTVTKKATDAKHVSTSKSANDDIMKLKAQNKVLSNALKQIQSCAEEHLNQKYDLVWFARNRCRYPNHEASNRIENSEAHRVELEKLKTLDCDYHHGFNSGVLATTRLFKQISEASHQVLDEEPIPENEEKLVIKHQDKVEKLKDNFPDLSVDVFP